MINMFGVNMSEDVDEPVLETIRSGYITQGPRVKEFEEELGEFLDNDNLVTVNSGTSALMLALRLAHVGPGDTVISTPMTCSATNVAIRAMGADIVFCDIDPKSGNANPESIAEIVHTPGINAKAIMVVAWGGLPVAVREIRKQIGNQKIPIIEDAAHAIVGRRYVKSLKDYCLAYGNLIDAEARADFTCFSFQAIKHLTTGDGGAVVLNGNLHLERARRLRWFGIKREEGSLDSRIDEDITEWGYKFHMNDIAATIGLANLATIMDIEQAHIEIAEQYQGELSVYFERFYNKGSAYWMFTVKLPDSAARDRFTRYMAQQDIQVSRVHRPNNEYTEFKDVPTPEGLKGVEDFASRMICLPVRPDMTLDEVRKVITTANRFAEVEGL